MNLLEEAKAYFQNDRFATDNGAVIEEVTRDYAVCSLQLTDHHRNAMGNVMGGAVFMLGDFAFAVASNFQKAATVSATPDHFPPGCQRKPAHRQGREGPGRPYHRLL